MPNDATAAGRGRPEYATPQQAGRANSLQPPQGVSPCEVGVPTPTPQPWEAAIPLCTDSAPTLVDSIRESALAMRAQCATPPFKLNMGREFAERLAAELYDGAKAFGNRQAWIDDFLGQVERGEVRLRGVRLSAGWAHG